MLQQPVMMHLLGLMCVLVCKQFGLLLRACDRCNMQLHPLYSRPACGASDSQLVRYEQLVLAAFLCDGQPLLQRPRSSVLCQYLCCSMQPPCCALVGRGVCCQGPRHTPIFCKLPVATAYTDIVEHGVGSQPTTLGTLCWPPLC